MVLMTGALASSASEQRHSVDGAWVVDNAPSYPGVTMLEIAMRGERTTRGTHMSSRTVVARRRMIWAVMLRVRGRPLSP